MSKSKLFNEYVTFFNGENKTDRCTGNLKIFSTYLAAKANNPAEILSKLELLGIDCDCKLIDNLASLLQADNPLGFDSVEIGDNGLFDITWELDGFNLLVEACHQQAIGIKINDVGYFPPNSILQILVRADGVRVLLDWKKFTNNVTTTNEGA